MNVRLLGVLCSCVLAVTGCESRVSLGSRCSADSECPSGLVCSVGRCRTTCESADDCESGRRCLAASGQSVCSTVPDDECLSVEDCGDPAFAACVDNECRTRCTDQSQCNGGECVLGGCVERPLLDTSTVGRVALPRASATSVTVGSFVVPEPASDGSVPLTMPFDEGFSDVAVVVEDTTVGEWSTHVATMQRVRVAAETVQLGVPTRIDVGHQGTRPLQWSVQTLRSSDATTVAAEPMVDGRAAYLWLFETPDPPTSPDRPGQFAAFARGTEPEMSMSGESATQRLPGRAFIATGFGADGEGPAWGLRVVDGSVSELQIAGPGAGGDLAAHVPIEGDSGRLDTVGTRRAALVRTSDGRVRFLRLSGDEMILHAVFELAERSSCAPGLVDRAIVAAGNYVVATCQAERVSLSRITCPSVESRSLEACEITPWLALPEPMPPASVELESWAGGIVLVSRDAEGVHVRPLADDASPAALGVRYDAVLPSSYRTDALTDFELLHVAANAAVRADGAIVVVAGFYTDDNDVSQIRLGVLEVSAP